MSLRLDTLSELVAEYPTATISISEQDRLIAMQLIGALMAALKGDAMPKIVVDQSLSCGSLSVEVVALGARLEQR